MHDIQTLTVYLGSSGHARPIFQQSAQKLGQLIAQHDKHLVYGGMDAGLMGILAKSALESGGKVTGIIPQNLKDSERILGNLTETILVQELSERKKKMFLMADAVLALPGGFGTLDESMELLYWGQKKLHAKPLMLINIDNYWDDLIAYLKTLPDYNPDYLIVAESLEEVFPLLAQWKAPLIEPETHEHYPHFEDEIMRKTEQPIVIDRASIENTYFGVCAIGLKQLHKTRRAIGFLNKDGQFDGLAAWFQKAAKEHFITQHCLDLFTIDSDAARLDETLSHQEYVEIDLHAAKWGAPQLHPED